MTGKTIQALRDEIKRLWVKMCEHEGIKEAEGIFCVFSDNNPFLAEYDKRMKFLQAIMRNMGGAV